MKNPQLINIQKRLLDAQCAQGAMGNCMCGHPWHEGACLTLFGFRIDAPNVRASLTEIVCRCGYEQ